MSQEFGFIGFIFSLLVRETIPLFDGLVLDHWSFTLICFVGDGINTKWFIGMWTRLDL
jgi:hypothetical protein